MAFIERKNESAVKARGVVGTGGVSKMVIEAKDPAIAGQEMAKLLESRRGIGIFLGACGGKFSQRNCGQIGRL